MRYLALTIGINGEVPNCGEGLMRRIANYFIKRGYHLEKVSDKITRPHGFYLFETNNPGQHSLLEFIEFLDEYRSEGVKYELVPLKDLAELSKF